MQSPGEREQGVGCLPEQLKPSARGGNEAFSQMACDPCGGLSDEKPLAGCQSKLF